MKVNAASGLNEAECSVLDVEAQSYRHTGAKLDAIRATGVSAVRHAQILNRLLDDERALAYSPVLVNRLRRLREARRR